MSDRLEQFSERLDALCEEAGIPKPDRKEEHTDEMGHMLAFHWNLPFLLAVPEWADIDGLQADELRAAYTAKEDLIKDGSD